jgi:hypothetical protein
MQRAAVQKEAEQDEVAAEREPQEGTTASIAPAGMSVSSLLCLLHAGAYVAVGSGSLLDTVASCLVKQGGALVRSAR